MDNNAYPPPSSGMSSQEDKSLSLRDIWSLCLHNWKWFALSLVLCLLAATFYILKTTPVYSRSASVLIKEDRKSGSVSSDISSAFTDLGFGQTRVNVNNEIINFSSPDLMQQVVRNLDLDVDYRKKGFFHDRTLYGSSLPVKVHFLSVGRNEGASLTVSPADSASVVLDDFVYRQEKVRGDIRLAYGDTVETPAGRVCVE